MAVCGAAALSHRHPALCDACACKSRRGRTTRAARELVANAVALPAGVRVVLAAGRPAAAAGMVGWRTVVRLMPSCNCRARRFPGAGAYVFAPHSPGRGGEALPRTCRAVLMVLRGPAGIVGEAATLGGGGRRR